MNYGRVETFKTDLENAQSKHIRALRMHTYLGLGQ